MITLNKISQSLIKLLPIYKTIIHKNNLTLIVPNQYLYQIIFFLNKYTNTQYKILSDICGVDYPERNQRFEVVYNLLSIRYNSRITIKTNISLLEPVKSITSIFTAANWWEREVWDLFGIFFKNHPDLRRILTDYGFNGYPLRKEFPLSGFLDIRYCSRVKRIIYEPIELTQEFRIYTYDNAWSNIYQ